MSEPVCPYQPTIDRMGLFLFIMLAVTITIVLVSLLWRKHPPTCGQVFLTPILILFLVLIFLGPIGQVVSWYMLRHSGVQTTAEVVAQHISSGAKTLHPYRIDFLYHVHGPDGTLCSLTHRDEPVSSDIYARHRVGSMIMIWYFPQNPTAAHTESAEGFAWEQLLVPWLVGGAAGLGRYLKQTKWL